MANKERFVALQHCHEAAPQMEGETRFTQEISYQRDVERLEMNKGRGRNRNL